MGGTKGSGHTSTSTIVAYWDEQREVGTRESRLSQPIGRNKGKWAHEDHGHRSHLGGAKGGGHTRITTIAAIWEEQREVSTRESRLSQPFGRNKGKWAHEDHDHRSHLGGTKGNGHTRISTIAAYCEEQREMGTRGYRPSHPFGRNESEVGTRGSRPLQPYGRNKVHKERKDGIKGAPWAVMSVEGV